MHKISIIKQGVVSVFISIDVIADIDEISQPVCVSLAMIYSSYVFMYIVNLFLSTFPHSYVFFTNHGESPRVERINMDGSNRVKIIENRQVVRPSGLTLDLVNRHVYSADSYLDTIERADYDGANRIPVLKHVWVHIFDRKNV